jgi:NAD(P)-dependent dehydrogenase (short-subunit alcohol dehydrogenase family)
VSCSRYANYPSLAGRKVVITGGATGIGRAMVEAFVEQGASVAFLDIDRVGAELLHRDLSDRRSALSPPALDRYGSWHALDCNVADIPALQSAIRKAQALLGGIDVLIANAADDTRHSLEELTPEAFDACIGVNVKHQLFAAQAAIPALIAAGGGSIICMGSIAWLNNTTGMIGYTLAKSAVHGLVRTLARQVGPNRVRVNALLPGWTMTARQLELWIDGAAEREIEQAQCLPDRLLPADVARMALFLAADDAAMCTQQAFVVDGGWI